MKTRVHLIPFVLLLLVPACSDAPGPTSPLPDPVAGTADEMRLASDPRAVDSVARAAGEVQLVWRGNAGATAHGDSVRAAVAEFSVKESSARHPDRGSFTYRVESLDGLPHRVITAAVDGVVIDPAARRVWLVGVVTADTKGCNGGPGGGHADGCEDEGGCTDSHDDGHDGGCTDGDHDDGGCSDGGHDDGSHDDGGCPDGSHEDGGCPEGGHDTGGSGGPTGATGRSCRVGQVIVAKAHDGGTPGLLADGVTWKWFLADDPDLPRIDDLAAWPHLCRKTITGGNLTIQVPGSAYDARPTADGN